MLLSQQPVVRLGAPQPSEDSAYQVEMLDGIQVWYAPTVEAEQPEHPITIDTRRILLSTRLKLENAKVTRSRCNIC